jgi:hypothetical protein
MKSQPSNAPTSKACNLKPDFARKKRIPISALRLLHGRPINGVDRIVGLGRPGRARTAPSYNSEYDCVQRLGCVSCLLTFPHPGVNLPFRMIEVSNAPELSDHSSTWVKLFVITRHSPAWRMNERKLK